MSIKLRTINVSCSFQQSHKMSSLLIEKHRCLESLSKKCRKPNPNFHSQAGLRLTIQESNENSKWSHLGNPKRGKTQTTRSWLVLFVSDWLRERDFLDQLQSVVYLNLVSFPRYLQHMTQLKISHREDAIIFLTVLIGKQSSVSAGLNMRRM